MFSQCAGHAAPSLSDFLSAKDNRCREAITQQFKQHQLQSQDYKLCIQDALSLDLALNRKHAAISAVGIEPVDSPVLRSSDTGSATSTAPLEGRLFDLSEKERMRLADFHFKRAARTVTSSHVTKYLLRGLALQPVETSAQATVFISNVLVMLEDASATLPEQNQLQRALDVSTDDQRKAMLPCELYDRATRKSEDTSWIVVALQKGKIECNGLLEVIEAEDGLTAGELNLHTIRSVENIMSHRLELDSSPWLQGMRRTLVLSAHFLRFLFPGDTDNKDDVTRKKISASLKRRVLPTIVSAWACIILACRAAQKEKFSKRNGHVRTAKMLFSKMPKKHAFDSQFYVTLGLYYLELFEVSSDSRLRAELRDKHKNIADEWKFLEQPGPVGCTAFRFWLQKTFVNAILNSFNGSDENDDGEARSKLPTSLQERLPEPIFDFQNFCK